MMVCRSAALVVRIPRALRRSISTSINRRHDATNATAAAPLVQGSYHSLLSTDQTLLKDTPSTSPRSLVKYLDSYVVGQTRAKKVLAVGVWNHYLRVASNERMKTEREQRVQQQQEEARLAAQPEKRDESPPLWSESVENTRNLRLGKYQATPRKVDEESAVRFKEIREQRIAEQSRDPHGEAMRELMFGRAEREWLLNSGGANENSSIMTKFGDDTEKWGTVDRRPPSAPPRIATKTPAEEAALSLKQQQPSADETREALLAHMPSPNATGKAVEPKASMTIGVFGGDNSYFSSNKLDSDKTSQVESKGTTSTESVAEEIKWTSVEERRAHAANFTDERARRALQDARERLSTPVNTKSRPPAEAQIQPRAPQPSSDPQSPNFLSASPGTLPFFEKSNILLLGPSGSGKTLLLRTLAQALEVPFVHVDATPLTMAGYVGEDVESIIQRLLVESGWDVERAQRGIICIDEVDKLRKTSGGASNSGRDVGGEGVQQALLRMLEGTTMQISDKTGAAAAGAKSHHGRGAKAQSQSASWPDRESGTGPEAWYNHRHGKSAADPSGQDTSPVQQGNTFQIDTSSILFVLSGAFVGIEETIRKRLAALTAPTQPSTTRWTQTDLLARLEPVDLEQYGLIPEFIGRVPVSVVLNPLTHQDLVRIMTEPKNSLVDQYKALFKVNGIELHISAGAIEEIVHRAMGTVSEKSAAATGSKTVTKESDAPSATPPTNGGGGARSLRRIMEDTLLDAFYESYGSDSSVKYILVDRQCVQQQHLGVKLFSRGQKFDFEAQCQADAEPAPKDSFSVRAQAAAANAERSHGSAIPVLSSQRAKQARIKARKLIRCRVRTTNRLVDPIIYV